MVLDITILLMCLLFFSTGKYDTPDRLFHSIENCYTSLLTNAAGEKIITFICLPAMEISQ